MKSNQNPIRAAGQRSITSTFLFRASNQSSDCNKNVEIKDPTKKGSHLSLSDFLNRKLHKNPVLPTSVPGKKVPFTSPVHGEDLNKGPVEKIGKNKGGEGEPNVSLDSVFHLFKNVEKSEKDHTNFDASNETESFSMTELQQPRKRKNQFDGHEHKPSARKVLAVLGDDSKPLNSTKRRNFARKEESKPLFNHYKNGGGWWDENMEGVDHENVGSKEIWEGVGCTTLGGIEWD
ncbi:hypothetical protein ACJIZ3_013629 [Penstemon smallii]|uniref:Uncharacterized protein n=1 Tax=Penstemon smallii TaxID=265156 RepID=A0ABD3RKQ6_9LAMI